jgi:hypothetical protein
MASKENGAGVISANGGKCPEGVKFMPYGDPHGKGAPEGYDDTLSGVDGEIRESMSDLKKNFKPRRP